MEKMKKTLNRKDTKKFIMDVLLMIAGATLTTIATKYVYDPAGLVTGGVSGMYAAGINLCHTILFSAKVVLVEKTYKVL